MRLTRVTVEPTGSAAQPKARPMSDLEELLRRIYWEHRTAAGGWHDAPQGKPCQDECFTDIGERAGAELTVMVADQVRAAEGVALPAALDVDALARAAEATEKHQVDGVIAGQHPFLVADRFSWRKWAEYQAAAYTAQRKERS